VSLGTLVSAVTFRNPAVLAKCVTTLDVLSHGRAILGIGAGWDEEEHLAYGIGYPSIGQRMDRLGEALTICRALFTEEAPTSVGSHYSINGAFNVPRPLNGDIPIMIGGGGERRTLRFVAAFADIWNCPGDPPTLRHKLEVLETIGRDPAAIAKTCLLMPPANVDDLLFAAESHLAVEGVDGLVVVIDQPDVSTIHAWGRALTETFS
jgi:alkanesulfonate monooxygenase SsuD/methylene tetrahydromethanopterin reductase-like flavin-dependent oxidoreductase (luciferase family)